MKSEPIYLDHHSHARLDPRIAAILAELFLTCDANAHSTHGPGEQVHRAVEGAREAVARLIGAASGEIIFTSGATEANNLAIQGFSDHLTRTRRLRMLVGAGEHSSILAIADHLCDGHVERVPLLPNGIVDLEALDRLLGPDVGLVSIAAANHEIGTVQPLADISRRVRAAGALLHSDLAQAAAWLSVEADLLDLASLSSHKLGGPIGIGALFVRRRLRRHLAPVLLGGGQEHGSRAGTLAAPLVVAFGAICGLVAEERGQDARRVATLRDTLLAQLERVGGVSVNGGPDRLPNNLNLSFDRVDGEALVLRLRDTVAVSTGSACTSTSLEPSHVLKAIGLNDQRAEGALRFGLGRHTTAEEIADAANAVIEAVTALRSISRRAA